VIFKLHYDLHIVIVCTLKQGHSDMYILRQDTHQVVYLKFLQEQETLLIADVMHFSSELKACDFLVTLICCTLKHGCSDLFIISYIRTLIRLFIFLTPCDCLVTLRLTHLYIYTCI